MFAYYNPGNALTHDSPHRSTFSSTAPLRLLTNLPLEGNNLLPLRLNQPLDSLTAAHLRNAQLDVLAVLAPIFLEAVDLHLAVAVLLVVLKSAPALAATSCVWRVQLFSCAGALVRRASNVRLCLPVASIGLHVFLAANLSPFQVISM